MTLADKIHEAVCTDAPQCTRYQPGHRHYQFYEDQARTLTSQLEPMVGRANVEAVVMTVIGKVL